ncbi:MAG: GDCCVxC domain-containing (seleno)protein [Gammaproteobacteria bacterium]
MHEIIFTSMITCPKCGMRFEEKMPTDRCVYYFECRQCGQLLAPKQGQCCVFCSYGDAPCPSAQSSELGS